MALVRVPDPNDPGLSAADWTTFTTLVKRKILDTNGPLPPQDSSGDIPKGFIAYIGGTLYYNNADLTPSGTPSRYIQITPSGATATAAYVANLSGVTWNSEYCGWYDVSGNLYVFDEVYAISDSQITEKHTRYIQSSIGNTEKLTGSGSWTVPAGVTRAKIIMSGGGGGGGGGGAYNPSTGQHTDGSAGSNGGDTTMTGVDTASGGVGGAGGNANPSDAAISDAPDMTAYNGIVPGAPGGFGGPAPNGSANTQPGFPGFPGLVVTDVLAVNPGDSISYSCGSGGGGGAHGTGWTYLGGDGGNGANGWILIEY